jgi:hypothetical protein
MSAFDSRVNSSPPGASDTRVAGCAPTRTEDFAAGRVVSIDTDDVDEFSQHAVGWSVQYHVLEATTFRSTVLLVMTPSLQVGLVRHAMGYSSQGDNPAGMLSIVVRVD